jgi:hypothetical protein
MDLQAYVEEIAPVQVNEVHGDASSGLIEPLQGKTMDGDVLLQIEQVIGDVFYGLIVTSQPNTMVGDALGGHNVAL